MSTLLKSRVGGEDIGSAKGGTFDNINPATGEMICKVAAADAVVVDRAVEAARAAQREWVARPAAERGRVLNRVAAILRERRQELARLEVLDTGKPIQEAPEADIGSAADCFEFFAGLTQIVHGEHMPLGDSAFAYTRREPLGVCAGIGAWNYPIQIASWKTAPALAAGNAMIFKPSELTPVTAVELCKIVEEAGAPPGLFNVVLGKGEVGAALADHPGIAKISLTGSVPTGKRVMAAAAGTLKHVTMELGGKSALIVFDDADIEDAVSAAILGNFYTQGEICSNATRVFVQTRIRSAFIERLVARTRAIKVGDPMDPATQMGPLISAEHLGQGLSYVARGKAEGAKLLTGGERLHGRARPRQLHRAGDLRSLPRRHDDRARGGVRPAPERAALRRRGGGRGARQRHAVRTCGRRDDPEPGARTSRRGGAGGRHRLDQQLQFDAGRDALRRLEAIRHRPRERADGARFLHRAQERLRQSRTGRSALLN